MFEKSEVTFSKLSNTEQNWPTRLISKRSPQPREKLIDLKPFIGEFIGTFKNQKFWNLADPSKKEFKSLKDQVKALLDSHNEGLKERESCTVLLEIFMIGKSEEQSCPTLVVICAKKGPLKRVAELIQKSKILDNFDGVFLGAASQDPRFRGTVQSIASGPDGGNLASMPRGTKVYIKRSDSNNSTLRGGTSIYIPMDEYIPYDGDRYPQATKEDLADDNGRFRKATIGGFLSLTFQDGALMTVAMTVAHAFHPLRQDEIESRISDESDDGDFEFEFVGPVPDGSLVCDNGSSTTTSSGDMSGLPVIDAPGQNNSIAHFTTEQCADLEEFGTLYATSTTKNSSNLDWAVIQVTKRGSNPSNRNFRISTETKSVTPKLQFSSGKNGIEVVTCTGSQKGAVGCIKGSSTLLKMERSQTFEVVWIIDFDGSLDFGDSGSWVVESNSREICGHIIAGYPGLAVAYVSPGEWTFRDIEAQLDCSVRLITEAKVNLYETGLTVRSRGLGADEEEKQIQKAIALSLATEKGEGPYSDAGLGNRQTNSDESISPDTGFESEQEMLDYGIRVSDETVDSSLQAELRGKGEAKAIASEEGDGKGRGKNKTRGKRDRARPNFTRGASNVPALSKTSSPIEDSMTNRTSATNLAKKPTIPLRANQRTTTVRTNEYFVPKEGIDREVIAADICRYLGNDALVRPGNYENPQTRVVQQGYFITAYRNLTTAMIADLKADSERWDAERRQAASREQPSIEITGIVRRSNTPITEYRSSMTHQSRQYYGPTEAAISTSYATPYQQGYGAPMPEVYAQYPPLSYTSPQGPLRQDSYYADAVAVSVAPQTSSGTEPRRSPQQTFPSTQLNPYYSSQAHYPSQYSVYPTQQTTDPFYGRPSEYTAPPAGYLTQDYAMYSPTGASMTSPSRPSALVPSTPDSGQKKIDTEQERDKAD